MLASAQPEVPLKGVQDAKCLPGKPGRACKPVDALYNIMQSFENKLGGGEGIAGLYGSITQTGMQKVLDVLKHSCGLDSKSVFIDIGAGIGRPLLHAQVACGVGSAWGVELDRVKCDKAATFMDKVLQQMELRGLVPPGALLPPNLHCMPVEEMGSLDPATHAYSFWEGVPTDGKMGFAQLFAASKTLKAVAVVQRAMRGKEPAAVMHELGFGPLLLIASFPVKMSGSGRSFTAYVFSKPSPGAMAFMAKTRGELPQGAAQAPTPPLAQQAAVAAVAKAGADLRAGFGAQAGDEQAGLISTSSEKATAKKEATIPTAAAGPLAAAAGGTNATLTPRRPRAAATGGRVQQEGQGQEQEGQQHQEPAEVAAAQQDGSPSKKTRVADRTEEQDAQQQHHHQHQQQQPQLPQLPQPVQQSQVHGLQHPQVNQRHQQQGINPIADNSALPIQQQRQQGPQQQGQQGQGQQQGQQKRITQAFSRRVKASAGAGLAKPAGAGSAGDAGADDGGAAGGSGPGRGKAVQKQQQQARTPGAAVGGGGASRRTSARLAAAKTQ